MLDFLKKKTEINTTLIVDEIEAAVYEYVKQYGFRKFGRTLHRFVSGDISQVIHFQTGMPTNINYGSFCVNVGIRIPECSERTFLPKTEKKKYYHEYECTIRSRLGIISDNQETWYDLHKKADKIINSIIEEIDQYVLPAYEVLNSREAILEHRRAYPNFDNLSNLMLLDECMIYGYLGDTEKAKECFEQYYQSVEDEYNDIKTNGRKIYMKKGEQIISGKEHIIADKDGYYTLYTANHSHIEYLDELPVKLGLR